MRYPPLIYVLLAIGLSCCGDDFPGKVTNIRPPSIVVKATLEQLKKHLVVPNSYIVGFKNHHQGSRNQFSSYFSEYQAHYIPLNERFLALREIDDIHYLTNIDLTFGSENFAKSSLEGPKSLDLSCCQSKFDPKWATIMKVDFKDNNLAARILDKWQREGKIWYAEPNYQSKLSEDTVSEYATTYSGLQNDSGASWFDAIDITKAFEAIGAVSLSSLKAPLIAVMDSGVDYEHSALADSVWTNQGGLESDCNNDHHGCNTTQSFKGSLGDGNVHPASLSRPGEVCPPKKEACPHGTHVAGIIAAKPGVVTDRYKQQVGYGGICPFCKILPIKIVGRTKMGKGSAEVIKDSSIIAGLTYVLGFKNYLGESPIRVVNASFGKFQRSRTVELLVRLMMENDPSILVIAAAGNEDTMLRTYPAALKDVVAVSNINADTKLKHPSSNYGIWVDVAAPGSSEYSVGKGILSTFPGDQYVSIPGTSMAAPVVAGIAGLILTAHPNLSANALKDRIINTAMPSFYREKLNTHYIPYMTDDEIPTPLLGSGIVNAANAVTGSIPSDRLEDRYKQRVTAKCGAIANYPKKNMQILLLLAIAPIFMLLLRRSFGSER